MSDNPLNPRMTSWDVSWNGNSLGTLNKVKPGLKYKLTPIKRGTTGEHILGHFVSALEGTLRIEVADINGTLMPQYVALGGTNSTSTELFPKKFNDDLYAYAKLITFHPRDMGTDLSEDLNLVKAAPMDSPASIGRDGNNNDIWELEFMIYPDREAILATPPVATYGYVGPIP